MYVCVLFVLFEVVIRSGIEHLPRVLLANTGAKVRIKNETAKSFAFFIIVIQVPQAMKAPYRNGLKGQQALSPGQRPG